MISGHEIITRLCVVSGGHLHRSQGGAELQEEPEFTEGNGTVDDSHLEIQGGQEERNSKR